MKAFVLLQIHRDPDGNLVDDVFVATGPDLHALVEHAALSHLADSIFLPGEWDPDRRRGEFDFVRRFRVEEVKVGDDGIGRIS